MEKIRILHIFLWWIEHSKIFYGVETLNIPSYPNPRQKIVWNFSSTCLCLQHGQFSKRSKLVLYSIPYNLGYDFPQDAKSEICFISTKLSQVTPFITLSIILLTLIVLCGITDRNPCILSHVMDSNYTKVPIQMSSLALQNT